jgi:glycosyltransferase 2 family protein
MEEIPAKKSKIPKWLTLLLKIAVTITCIWYVSGKIDFKKAGATLQTVNWFYLTLALFAFIFSKLVSAVRLNIYFKNAGISLPNWQNIKLYALGMFYNLFLPGSISGDAYKVILLKRKYNAPYKKTTAAVLLDRFSGLLGLGLILGVYSILVLDEFLYVIAFAGGSILAVLALYFIISRWLKDFTESFFPTLLLGILVQGAQVICACLIMLSLGIPVHATEYIFIFLVSSVVAVLPLTIGGLGIRELVFLEGAAIFGLVQETSVVISLLFYLITLVTSAAGVFYVFNNPLKEKKDSLLSP